MAQFLHHLQKDIDLSYSHNRLLLQKSRSFPLTEVKTIDMIKFIKHHFIYDFGCQKELSMTMNHNLLVKRSLCYVTNS